MGRRPTVNLNLPPRMRSRARGRKVFFYFDAGGKPRREIPLGSDFPEAVRKWADLERESKKPKEDNNFRALATRYLAEVLPTKAERTQADNLKELAKLREFFGDCPDVSTIEPKHVREFMDWRTDNGTGAKVRATREKALLSHMLNKAREWGMSSTANPCAGIRGYSAGRVVYVEDETLEAVYSHACSTLRDALDLAYLTGQRPADVRKMDESAIQGGAIAVRQNKTGAALRIRIEGELAEVLDRIAARKRATGSETLALVVNEEGEDVKADALRYRFDRARDKAAKKLAEEAAKEEDGRKRAELERKAAAIRGFQFRDLRAKAATDKAEAVGDIRQAQKQLGHASPAMTEKYVRARRGEIVAPTR